MHVQLSTQFFCELLQSPAPAVVNCRYTFTYTRNIPFEGRTLTPGEIIIAFVLYTDTLLSINQVAQLFEAVYDTIHMTIREVEDASERGFHLVWTRLTENGDSPTQIDETGQECSGFKGQTLKQKEQCRRIASSKMQ